MAGGNFSQGEKGNLQQDLFMAFFGQRNNKGTYYVSNLVSFVSPLSEKAMKRSCHRLPFQVLFQPCSPQEKLPPTIVNLRLLNANWLANHPPF